MSLTCVERAAALTGEVFTESCRFSLNAAGEDLSAAEMEASETRNGGEEYSRSTFNNFQEFLSLFTLFWLHGC